MPDLESLRCGRERPLMMKGENKSQVIPVEHWATPRMDRYAEIRLLQCPRGHVITLEGQSTAPRHRGCGTPALSRRWRANANCSVDAGRMVAPTRMSVPAYIWSGT